MDSTELERVQDDLRLLKSALGRDFPYNGRDVALCLLVAGSGVVVALTAMAEWRAALRVVLIAYFVGIVLVWLWQFRQTSIERAARPRAWSWNRRSMWATVVGCGLLVPYVVLMRWLLVERGVWHFAAWRDVIAGPVMFFVGTAVTSVCITTRELRYGLGFGIAAVVSGIIIPCCESPGQTRLVLGLALLIGGLASAAILAGQIRHQESAHATD